MIDSIPDVYNQINSQTYSLIEGTSVTKTPDLTCSYSGSTSITYSISNYLTQAPSWVSINSASGQLIIVAPNVTVDATYSFYINSVASGTTIQKLISVTVLNWAVVSCSTCSSSVSICSVCSSGYSLTTSGTCLTDTTTISKPASVQAAAKQVITWSAKVQAAVNLVVIVAISWITGVLGFSNVSSLANLWSMLGQVQLQWFTVRLLITKWIKIGARS